MLQYDKTGCIYNGNWDKFHGSFYKVYVDNATNIFKGFEIEHSLVLRFLGYIQIIYANI